MGFLEENGDDSFFAGFAPSAARPKPKEDAVTDSGDDSFFAGFAPGASSGGKTSLAGANDESIRPADGNGDEEAFASFAPATLASDVDRGRRLGRVLPSKKLRAEAKSAKDHARARLAEIAEMDDPQEKRLALTGLLSSIGQKDKADWFNAHPEQISTDAVGRFVDLIPDEMPEEERGRIAKGVDLLGKERRRPETARAQTTLRSAMIPSGLRNNSAAADFDPSAARQPAEPIAFTDEEAAAVAESRGPVTVLGEAKKTALKTESMPFYGSVVQARRILDYGAARDRLKDPENYPLRDRDPQYAADVTLATSKENEDLVEAFRSEKGGWRYLAGNVAGQMPAFVVEMWATGGLHAAGKVAVRKAVLGELAEQSFKQVAQRGPLAAARYGVAKAGGWASGSALQAAGMPQRIAASAADRYVRGDGAGEAVAKGFVDTFMEVGSEHSGGLIEDVLKAPFKGMGAAARGMRTSRMLAAIEKKTAWTAKELEDLRRVASRGGASTDFLKFRAGLGKASDGTFAGSPAMSAKMKAAVQNGLEREAVAAAGRVGAKKAAQALSDRFGINVAEIGEEFVGDSGRALFGLNDDEKSRTEQLGDVWKNAKFWDPAARDQLIGMAVGFAPMSGIGIGVSAVGNAVGKAEFKRAQAERVAAWKKAGDEAPPRKWLDRYAVAKSPEEWRQVEREQLEEVRDNAAAAAEQAGVSKEAVGAIRAAEDYKGLESAWKAADGERVASKRSSMAAAVRAGGLGEDLAKRFEAAETADDLASAMKERFALLRDREAADLESKGRKEDAKRLRAARNEAEYEAALDENRLAGFRRAADDMEADGYLPDEVKGIRTAKTDEEAVKAGKTARFSRSRRVLAEAVSKAPGASAERLASILAAKDAKELEEERFRAFREFALPDLLKVSGLPEDLPVEEDAGGFDSMRVDLAQSIAEEIQAPVSGLPSYMAEAILSGDGELAAYFGTLRGLRLEEWRQAVADNMSAWAGTPESSALLELVRSAKTEKDLAGVVRKAESVRKQAEKAGLAGAAASLATDAVGAEDRAAAIVEAMAQGRMTSREAISRIGGAGKPLPGIPDDPLPPLEDNPLWKKLAQPDFSGMAEKIAGLPNPSIEKVGWINEAREMIGLPELSAEAEKEFVQADGRGLLTARSVAAAIRMEEKARKKASAAGKAPVGQDKTEEADEDESEAPEIRRRRMAEEIASASASPAEIAGRLDEARSGAGLPAMPAAERSGVLQAIRDGTFTADDAERILSGAAEESSSGREPRRGLFTVPVSRRGRPADDASAPRADEKPGDRVELRTPQGNMRVSGRLRVVDLFDDVATSYDGDYEVKELQNRGLDGLTIDDPEPRVDKIVKEFDHRELLSSTTSESGPPVLKRIGKKLNVLSGNGRTKALRKLHRQGRLGEYAAAVRAEAARRGIEIPESVEVPMLAVELEDGVDLHKFVYLSNKDKIDGFNAYEKALNDADVILREGLLDKFAPGESGDVLTEENRDFWVSFIDAVGERKQLLDSDNRPDDSLEPRIRRAILAALFKGRSGGRETVQALVERSRDLGAKAQITAILSAAGPVLKVAKEKPAFSIADDFAEAVEMFLDYKANEGAKIRKKTDAARAAEKYLASPRMFQKERGAVAKTIFRILATSPGIAAIRERFSAYAQSVAALDVTTEDLFGSNDAASSAARDRSEKIRRLQAALGVQVKEDAEKSDRPFLRPMSQRREAAETFRVVRALPRSTSVRWPDGTVAHYAMNRADALDAARKDWADEKRRQADYAARPTAAQGEAMAERLKNALASGERLNFAGDVVDLPDKVRRKVEREANFGKSTKAFTLPDGSVWILAKRHRDLKDLAESILHEDLESIMMRMAGSADFARRLDEAFAAAGLTAAYNAELRNVVVSYDYVADSEIVRAAREREDGWEDAVSGWLAEHADARFEVMRELLATVRQRRAAAAAKTAKADKGMWDVVLEAVRKFLSEIFGVDFSVGDLSRTVPEIERLIDEMAENGSRTKPKADKTLFRNESGAETLAATKTALENMEPVAIDSSSLGDPSADGFVRAAERIYRTIGTASNGEKTIRFVMSGFKKLRSHRADSRTLRVIPGLKKLMESAIHVFEAEDERGRDQIKKWHTYAARASLDGEPVFVKLVVREEKNGKMLLDYFDDSSVTTEEAIRTPRFKRGPDSLSKDKLYQWWHSVKDGEAKFRNEAEEDPAMSAVPEKESAEEKAAKLEARWVGKIAGERDNLAESVRRHARILKKVWPAPGRRTDFDSAQSALEAELRKLKAAPERRRAVRELIAGLKHMDGSELKTAVLDVLKEFDSISGFDPAVSAAAYEMFSDREWVGEVLSAMADGEATEAEAAAAAKKLKWAAPIYRKGVKAGWEAAEKDNLHAFFLARYKKHKKANVAFDVNARLLADWGALSSGMEGVRAAAKDETRSKRARAALRTVLGPEGMERVAGLAERDPVEALRMAMTVVRALVFEVHAGRILDAMGSRMLLSRRDVSYFAANPAPRLEDVSFNNLNPSVKPELRALLENLPWQAIFSQKALEDAEGRARDLGGEYDGKKIERIRALRAKQRQKILDWLEGIEPIELVSVQFKLKGLLEESLVAQAAVLAGARKELHEIASAVEREALDALPEIPGQAKYRAKAMGGWYGFKRLNMLHSTPETLALMIGGGDVSSAAYKALYLDVLAARDAAAESFMRQMKSMEAWYAKNGITEEMRASWRSQTKEWVFKLQGADLAAEPVVLKFNLTPAELMDLAAHLQDDETQVDVARGARLGPIRQKTTSNAPKLPSGEYFQAFRKAVFEALTPEQRKVVGRMVSAVSAMGPQVNAMSMRLEGREIAYSARHWERKRDMGGADPDAELGVSKKPLDGGGLLATSKQTKERVANRRGIFLRDVFDHFDRQVKWASAYAHFALAQKTVNDVLTYRRETPATEERAAEVLDLNNVLSRRIGEDNVKSLAFAVDRIAGDARLDDGWGKLRRILAGIYRNVSGAKLAIRPSSILNNAIGGSIMLASRMGMIDGFSAADYWAARARVTSPTAPADKELKAIKAAILDDPYFWKRLVWNRFAVQTQHLYEGEYEHSKKRLSSKMEEWMNKALAGMSAQELHNAMACVLALQKKGWSVPNAIQWTKRATELTQNPSDPLDETNAYVWVKKSGTDMFLPFFGQLSVEAGLLRREGVILAGTSKRLSAAKRKAAVARQKMDKAAEKIAAEEVERLREKTKTQRRNFRKTVSAISTSAAYTAIQNAAIYYLKRGAIPLVGVGFWQFVLKSVGRDLLSRVSPFAESYLVPQAKTLWNIVRKLVDGKKFYKEDFGVPDVIVLQTIDRLLRSANEIRFGDPVKGSIDLSGPASELLGLPMGGVEQIGGVGYGVWRAAQEGWTTDIRTPVSRRARADRD